MCLLLFRQGSIVTNSPFSRRFFSLVIAAGCVGALALSAPLSASADTIIDGPVNLGTAITYGVLGATAVTNTNPTVVNGDVGISPGSSVTGFEGAPDGTINGTLHQTDAAALKAQQDANTAYNVAAGLTPQASGLTELAGQTLTPGVYRGDTQQLSNNGTLTLAGSANSVWVFQASSTLTIGSGTSILITGGASACNVFWQVGSSASIGTDAAFQGTVLALTSITATTRATIVGRLLALNGAVTLDTNTITASTGCPPAGTPSESAAPVITSATPANPTAGTPYTHTITSSGNPTATYTVTGGSLPAGLVLDSTTGVISGTPTTPGDSTFTVTASNGFSPDSSVTYTVTTLPAPGTVLANTGIDASAPLAGTGIALLAGMTLLFSAARRRRGVTVSAARRA
ncbi:LPXTG-motif cell wall-anchored protein [Agreia sp. COWG]|nr:LPXTG-motif cell wall-anchored protein [Agreia sp. COWG]